MDYGAIGPGYLYVADHHNCDWWVTDAKGRQIRPWLTVIQDCRSRCFVGWHIGPAPHTDAIIVAMRMAFRDWAIPVKCRIDQGRDFTSKQVVGISKIERARLRRELGPDWKKFIQRNGPGDDRIDARWLGTFGELNIEPINAIPYSPWSKGTLERAFGRVEDELGKTFVTYCGNSTLNRPECLEEIRRGYSKEQRRRLKKLHGEDWRKHVILKLVDQADIPTLEESRERFAKWVEVYHNSPHRGRDMRGATPLEVWKTATDLRRAVEDDLLCLMDVRGIYRVGPNGVSLTVGSGTIPYGKRSPELKRWVGREVLILMSPDDVSHCWAYTPDLEKRAPIARLEPNEFIAPNTTADDAREAIAEQMRERSIMHKAQRSSAGRTRTAAQRMNEHNLAKHARLLATGTDHRRPADATISLVRTGFEGLSRPDRTEIETVNNWEDDRGLEDLFLPEDTGGDCAEDDDEDMECLFSEPADHRATDADDDGLEDLL